MMQPASQSPEPAPREMPTPAAQGDAVSGRRRVEVEAMDKLLTAAGAAGMSGSPSHSEAEWHALRARNVGSSEIAILFDCAPPYSLSKFALWHVKAGLIPAPEVDNPRTRWGNKLEDVIAHAAAEDRGWVISKASYVADPDCPGMGCTPDYWIEPGTTNAPGLLECKSVDWLMHRTAWSSGEPPPHILLQLQHQLACTGCAWGAVAALVGGNDLRIYHYERRDTIVTEIRRRVREFWASIEAGEPPPVDGKTSTGDALRNLYPALVDDDVLDLTGDNAFPIVCADLVAATAARKEAEEREEELKNRLRLIVGKHKRAFGGGYSVNVAVAAEKLPRPPRPGEMIPGRKETRRMTVKMQEMTREPSDC